jgi:hypothetical protein
MSVCNIYVGKSKIMCLSDTMEYKDNKPAGLCDYKTHILVGGRGAWCFRGRIRVGMWLKFLVDQQKIDCITAFEERLQLYSYLMKEEIESDRYGEVTLFGQSEAPVRLKAIRYRFLPNGKVSERQEIGLGVHLQPSPGEAVKFPDIVSEETMVKLALAQHKVNKHFNTSLCIGGIMHLTTATLKGVDRKIVGSYPDYDIHKEKFNCPNERQYDNFIRNLNGGCENEATL